MASKASAEAARRKLLGGRDARIGEANGELAAEGSDECAAVVCLKLHLSFGLGAQPNRSTPHFVRFRILAREQVPVNVRLRIAEAFVVHLPRLDDGGDGLCREAHLVSQLARRVCRHEVELGRVQLGEEHAVAAVDLLIAEDDVAARQLRDEVRESARLDAIDHCADSAGGGHAGFSVGTSTSLMLAPLSNSLTVFSLYGRA